MVNGTKILPVSEIKKQFKWSISVDLLDYLNRCPESIKNMCLSWIEPEEKRQEVLMKMENRRLSLIEDMESETSNLHSDIKEIKSLKPDEIIETLPQTGDINPVEDDSYNDNKYVYMEEIITESSYETYSFDDRISVSFILFSIINSNLCPIHQSELEKMQVVAAWGNGKKYGSYFCACKKCKKLFISLDDWEELQPIYFEKHIPYKKI